MPVAGAKLGPYELKPFPGKCDTCQRGTPINMPGFGIVYKCKRTYFDTSDRIIDNTGCDIHKRRTK